MRRRCLTPLARQAYQAILRNRSAVISGARYCIRAEYCVSKFMPAYERMVRQICSDHIIVFSHVGRWQRYAARAIEGLRFDILSEQRHLLFGVVNSIRQR